MSSKINLEQLRREIQNLQRWQPLYKVLKEELTAKGYWRLLKRGKPEKGFVAGWGKNRDKKDA